MPLRHRTSVALLTVWWWPTGAPTITNNHKDKLSYFGSVNK